MASVWGAKLAREISPYVSMVNTARLGGDPDALAIRANWEKCRDAKFTTETDYNEVMAALNRLLEKRK